MNEGELLTRSIESAISGIGFGAGVIGAGVGLAAAVAVLIALLAGNPRAMSLGLSLWLVGSVLGLGPLVAGHWPLAVLAVTAAPVGVILGVLVRLVLVRRSPSAAGLRRDVLGMGAEAAVRA